MAKIRRNIIHTYKMHESMKELGCIYCGKLGQSKDHIPPVSYSDYFDEERIIVRSCLLCNSLLGNKILLTILERCDYLLIRYHKRFKSTLSLPIWTESEIDELTGKLRVKVVMGLKKKKYIEEKILFIKNNITLLQGY